MCYGCWGEYGYPKLDNENVKRAAKLIKQVYDFSPTGGNLHIYLDDWNIEDYWFEDNYRQFIDDSEMKPGQRECELILFNLFGKMTEIERASALALENGFWNSKPDQKGGA